MHTAQHSTIAAASEGGGWNWLGWSPNSNLAGGRCGSIDGNLIGAFLVNADLRGDVWHTYRYQLAPDRAGGDRFCGPGVPGAARCSARWYVKAAARS